MTWETLDVESLLCRREEQTGGMAAGGGTTSANAGAYPVPLGRPLRRKFPVSPSQYQTVGARAEASDAEYLWALGMIRSDY